MTFEGSSRVNFSGTQVQPTCCATCMDFTGPRPFEVPEDYHGDREPFQVTPFNTVCTSLRGAI